MKTKDLIAALQAEDPSGELEVAVGNADIHFLCTEPAYYDGCLQVLKRSGHDDRYDIIGGEFRGEGLKVVISALSIWDAIDNDPEMTITFDGQGPRRDYAQRVEIARTKAREMNRKFNKAPK